MAVLSANDLDRFTPPHRANDPAPPVYLIAPMTWRQRAAWRADLARGGVSRIPTDEEFVRGVRSALEEVAPDNLTECLDAVDAMLGVMAAPPLGPEPPAFPTPEGEQDTAPPPDPAREAEIKRRTAVLDAYGVVERAMLTHPRVAGMAAERSLFNSLAPMLAVAHALRGWEGVDVPFARRNGIVPDDVLDRVPEDDLRAAGYRALELMRVSETARKN